MRTLESSGRSVDEAIFNGLQELEISIDEVEIEIVQQETKGVFGIGARPAIVKLIERVPEEIVMPNFLREQEELRTERQSARRPQREGDQRGDRGPRRDRGRGGRDDRGASGGRDDRSVSRDRDDRGTSGGRDDRGVSRDRGERRSRDDRGERLPRVEKPAIDYSAEVALNNPGAEFLRGLLGAMGIEGTVLANVTEENGIRLRIDSASMGILIGHRGETLDALQYLTSLAVNRNRKEEGYTRVTIDTENYRDKREETLARLARKVASQVRSTGRPRTLEPMNPYERHVLHASLQDSPHVITYSEGEEPNRHVIIAPKPRGDSKPV